MVGTDCQRSASAGDPGGATQLSEGVASSQEGAERGAAFTSGGQRPRGDPRSLAVSCDVGQQGRPVTGGAGRRRHAPAQSGATPPSRLRDSTGHLSVVDATRTTGELNWTRKQKKQGSKRWKRWSSICWASFTKSPRARLKRRGLRGGRSCASRRSATSFPEPLEGFGIVHLQQLSALLGRDLKLNEARFDFQDIGERSFEVAGPICLVCGPLPSFGLGYGLVRSDPHQELQALTSLPGALLDDGAVALGQHKVGQAAEAAPERRNDGVKEVHNCVSDEGLSSPQARLSACGLADGGVGSSIP